MYARSSDSNYLTLEAWIFVTAASIAEMERMSAKENVSWENRRRCVKTASIVVQKSNCYII